MIQTYRLDPKECIVIPERTTAEECGYNPEDYICILAVPIHEIELPEEKGFPWKLAAEWHCLYWQE